MRDDAKHRSYAVGELAKLSGVSIRTLHHYDAIGLLKPASVGENGYRYYGREELLRLQQILFHRELGMSLAEIAAVLEAPGFDRLAALRRQRVRVMAETDRHRRLLDTIDRTIAELEGKQTVQDGDLYKGFAPEKQAEYEAYIVERYGEDGRRRVEAGRKRMAEMSSFQQQAYMDELAALEADLVAAVGAGVAANSDGGVRAAQAGLRAAQALGWFRRALPCDLRRQPRAAIGWHVGCEAPYCGCSTVSTWKLTSLLDPKLVEIATSIASRPRPMRIRPIRGTLWRASNVYQPPSR